MHIADCTLHKVWQSDDIIVYPRFKLMAYNGLLLRYRHPTVFGLEHVQLKVHRAGYIDDTCIYLILNGADDGDWSNAFRGKPAQNITRVYGVGVACVRTLQRWFRQILSQRRVLAVMMATHKRLGRASGLHGLDYGLLQLLCTKLCAH